MKKIKVEVWIMVNEEGEYTVGTSEEDCYENYAKGGDSSLMYHKVKLWVEVPVPEYVVMEARVMMEAKDSLENVAAVMGR